MVLDDKEIELFNKEISQNRSNNLKNNLLITVGFIIIFILSQIVKGKIDFTNLNGKKYLPKDYIPKPFIEDFLEKMLNIKEYLIFFICLFIFFLIIHKSNLEWERKILENENNQLNLQINKKEN